MKFKELQGPIFFLGNLKVEIKKKQLKKQKEIKKHTYWLLSFLMTFSSVFVNHKFNAVQVLTLIVEIFSQFIIRNFPIYHQKNEFKKLIIKLDKLN